MYNTNLFARIVALSVLATAAVTAQPTRIGMDQLKALPGTGVRLLAMDEAGKLFPLSLGPGVGISNGQIVVMATAIPSVAIVPLRLSLAADGTYLVPPGQALYSRNGLLQEADKDYKIEAGKLTPLLGAWAADDVVVQYQIKVNGTPTAFVGLSEAVKAAGL